jgi:hypothetical protein
VTRIHANAPRRGASALVALIAAGAFLLAAPPAGAWSTKEHLQMTRLAAERLLADPHTPAAMKDWLRRAAPGLMSMGQERQWFLTQRTGVFPRGADGIAFWATVPDLSALTEREGDVVQPFGVHERLLHFLDVELFNPDPAKRTYRDDLSAKPRPEDFPRDMNDPRYARAGMLPFRVEQAYGELVKNLRAGRLSDAPGQFPRDEHAAKWAGYLAHYAQDNTQPQHATADYKSARYFGNARAAPNVHADVEYRLGDDEWADYPALREEFWAAFAKSLDEVKDPVETDDPWRATLEVTLASYDALPLIGAAARAAYPEGAGRGGSAAAVRRQFDADAFFHHKGTVAGRETTVLDLKAHQMAWAVRRTERLWRRAWAEASATPSKATGTP